MDFDSNSDVQGADDKGRGSQRAGGGDCLGKAY